jgi:uncharacterized RDD family membrane protein YckC
MTDATEAPPSPFEQALEIETPERVRIRYELAGIGSRFAAGTIDVFLLGFVLFVLFVVFVIVRDLTLDEFQEGLGALSIAAYGVALATVWVYYLGFELLWDGQTPGKRVMRLRVVSDAGGPAPASAVVVRNVLRVADMVPAVLVHLLGGIVMFLNGRSKRLGDFAAGTVVVQEREVELTLDRLSRGVLDELREDELGGSELARLKSFVARRKELRPERRAAVADQLLADLRERHELPEADPESLLVLLAAGRRPSDLRDLGGPQLPDEPEDAAP